MVERLVVETDDGDLGFADFRRLPGPHKEIAFLPQWNFLDFVTRHAAEEPGFTLLLEAEATGLLRDGDQATGLSYRDAGGSTRSGRTGRLTEDHLAAAGCRPPSPSAGSG